MTRVNPAILRWARETAGLSPEEAAAKIDLNPTKRATAVERIAALEDGEDEPSRALLLRMSKQYRRPLVSFYLSNPPRRGERGQDFRTLPEEHEQADEVLLDALVRDVMARQGLVRDAVEEEDAPAPLAFVGSLNQSIPVRVVVDRLRDALDSPLPAFRASSDAESAFKVLRDRVERLGAFVVLLGDLGSHHTALTLETFRGLAIADPIAPFIVINDQDSRAAWSFSLIHELTHLWLGQTGISGGAPDAGIERFCNEVAAEFLLPASELESRFRSDAPAAPELDDWIGALSRDARVSRTMIAYQLFSREFISSSQWNELRGKYRDQWLANRARRREVAREAGGGPSYYVVRRQRLGNALLDAASRLLASGALTTSKTARVLGVKPTQVEPLLGGRRSARVG